MVEQTVVNLVGKLVLQSVEKKVAMTVVLTVAKSENP
jgi:hypothetical protein